LYIRYFIEHRPTNSWWIPALILDEQTQLMKITSDWTKDPHHPQVGYATKDEAQKIIDTLLSEVAGEYFVGEHMFLDMSK
jgi:hypothetical protein